MTPVQTEANRAPNLRRLESVADALARYNAANRYAHVSAATRPADAGPDDCPDCGARGRSHLESADPIPGRTAPMDCPYPTAPAARWSGESAARFTQRVGAWYELRQIIRPGDTVHVILRHVSRSGMLRRISPVLIRPEGGRYYLDRLAAELLGERGTGAGDGVPMTGAGMDMGFALVYEMAAYLYGHDNRGAYAIRHEWL